METLARTFISLVDLAAVEARALRRGVVATTADVGLLVLAGLVLLIGLGFSIVGVRGLLAQLLGPDWANIVVGLCFILLSVSFAILVRQRNPGSSKVRHEK